MRTLLDFCTPLAITAAVILFGFVGVNAAGDLNRWEAKQGYPYGRLCDLFNVCSK